MRRTPAAAATRSRARLIRGFALLALSAATLFFATRARAEMSALSESELSEVRGQAAATDRDGKLPPVPLVGGLLALIPAKDIHLSTLDKAAFDAALAARGMAPLNGTLYDGRPVTQMAIDGAPVNASFDAGALFGAFGVHYQGPSFGTININGLNASGTTLWVWTH